ncbi:MAG: hypothetical protein PHC56_10340 [Herbinix sp.]|nr:hypothetical protein [Herbinix sp.]
MIESSKSKNVRALKEAAKRNGLIYKKHNKGTESEFVKLVDEKGNSFQLNNNLSIKKCDDDDNELAVAEDKASKKKAKSVPRKKTSYKMQKGLQKA